jgi:hypothetical protein
LLSYYDIDGLVIHQPGVVTKYWLNQHDGLDMPEIRATSYDNPGEHGATLPNSLYGGRLITLGGVVRGDDPASYLAARRALAYAARIRYDSTGLVTTGRHTFTALDGAQYFVDAAVIPPYKAISPSTNNSPFQFHFLVQDPAIYGVTLQSTGLITRQTGGGATFPLTFPITFSGGNPGTGIITNSGNLETWPIIYLRGQMTNPRIYNIEGQKPFQLNYTTTSNSDVITINMRRKTIMLNGTTSLLRYRDQTDRNWFSLGIGLSTLLFTTSNALDAGTMEGTAYPAFLGL